MTDGLPKHRLYPPGTRKNNKTYVVRFQLDGERREVATDSETEEGALAYLRRLMEAISRERKAHKAHQEERLRVTPQPVVSPATRLSPQGLGLGNFERWFFETHCWSEGLILRRTGGILRFYKSAHGYRSARVEYLGEVRSVLEHRMVYLLIHGWLPQSIDHRNRNREDNRPSNLVASTPLLQARNRSPWGGRQAIDESPGDPTPGGNSPGK